MGHQLSRLLISVWAGLWIGVGAVGCGKTSAGLSAGPQVDESGFEHARRLGPEGTGPAHAPSDWDATKPAEPPPTKADWAPTRSEASSTPRHPTTGSPTSGGEPAPTHAGPTRFQLSEVMNLRFEKAGRLEFSAELPPGAVIEIPAKYSVVALPFRDSHGGYRASSTGFVTPVRVISVPKSAGLSEAAVSALNSIPGGLYVFASILGNVEGIDGSFSALKLSPPSAQYLRNFEASGRPVQDFHQRLSKKFGSRLDVTSGRGADVATRDKWKRVYAELVRVANREVATPRNLLMIPSDEAQKWSKELERTGHAPPNGAWTIAVTATAPRHGFSNVPCAEFVSEVIREAYVRSGMKFNDDFNHVRKNELIWYGTADVEGLTRALVRAGFVPWSAQRFQAPIGAIMMNGVGESPGHAFIAAGARGRFIIDNGSPQGRDLGLTRAHSLENMYSAAVFFLPPGIQPARW